MTSKVKINLIVICAIAILGAIGMTSALAQKRGLIQLETESGSVPTSENLTFLLSPQSRSAAIQLSGLSSRDDEIEKCKVLVELSSGDPETVFDGAVSPLTLELIVAESRDEQRLGVDWINILRKALPSNRDVFFDIDSSEKYHFPDLENMDASINLENFNIKLLNRDEAYLRNALANIFNISEEGYRENFSDNGTLVFRTADQAAICAHLLAEKYEVNFNLRLRTFDRVKRTWKLDIACLSRRIERMNEFFRSSKIPASIIGDGESFMFLIGVIATEVGVDQSGWFGGPTGSKNLCFNSKKVDTLIGIEEGMSAWTAIAKSWTSLAIESGSPSLTKTQQQTILDRVASLEAYKTGIIYGFLLQVEAESINEVPR